MSSRKFLFLFVLVASVTAGCSDGTTSTQVSENQPCLSGSTDLDCKAAAEVRQIATGKLLPNSAKVEVQVGSVVVGAQMDLDFSIVNSAGSTAASALVIKTIRLEYEAASPAETAASRAFECYDAKGQTKCSAMDGKWAKVVPASLAGADGIAQEQFRIRYKHFDSKVRKGKVCIDFAGDLAYATQDFCMTFQTTLGKPKILVAPTDVLFPYVPLGSELTSTVTVTNSGDAALLIDRIDFEADPAFNLVADNVVHAPGQPIEFNPIREVAPGSSWPLVVRFSPVDGLKRSGLLKIRSNDTSAPVSGVPVVLTANSKVPCLKLTPEATLNFGAVVFGNNTTRDIEVASCGSEVLTITSIDWKAGSNGNFTPDWTLAAETMPGLDPVKGPTADKPLKLGVNQSVKFQITYEPNVISPIDEATGVAKPDVATLVAASNAAPQNLVMQGIGVKEACPQAKIEIDEGEEVIPQTTLHFDGTSSVAPGGGVIKGYKWSVQQQPEGSAQTFLPSTTFPTPTFTPNVAGEYIFCLVVTDGTDQKSCVESCLTVLVLPSDSLHVELLWNTPADKNETDSGPAMGSDVDLHFAHQDATGPDLDCDGTGDPWFSNPFDTFWLNPAPNWGSMSGGVPDDPTLDLDDTDGAGPENLNLAQPAGTQAEPMTYPIGVHYWNDHGFGTSFATLRIYVFGTQVVEFQQVELHPLDMWYVGKLNWPNEVAGGKLPVLTACKQTGSACLAKKDPSDPKGGQMWQTDGADCITPCYQHPATPSGGATCK